MSERSHAFEQAWTSLQRRAAGCERALADRPARCEGLEADEAALIGVYERFLQPPAQDVRVLAHLGSSLCGRIATDSGHSTYVNGPENLIHLHRLRSLADAVLVGAGTVAADDPRLTVRHVEGRNPIRVVLDPRRRLEGRYRVFCETPPRTWIVCGRDARDRGTIDRAELLSVEEDEGALSPARVLRALAEQGIARLFIEGGGTTVSRFLRAGCLDHLHLCVAPVLIGSGRPAITLPPILTMDEAIRVRPTVVPMGDDWLFASDLERRATETA